MLGRSFKVTEGHLEVNQGHLRAFEGYIEAVGINIRSEQFLLFISLKASLNNILLRYIFIFAIKCEKCAKILMTVHHNQLNNMYNIWCFVIEMATHES